MLRPAFIWYCNFGYIFHLKVLLNWLFFSRSLEGKSWWNWYLNEWLGHVRENFQLFSYIMFNLAISDNLPDSETGSYLTWKGQNVSKSSKTNHHHQQQKKSVLYDVSIFMNQGWLGKLLAKSFFA